MSSDGVTESEPLSAVATIEKGTVNGVGGTDAGSSTPKFIQLVMENSGHFVTLSVHFGIDVGKLLAIYSKVLESFLEHLANYQQVTGNDLEITGKLTHEYRQSVHSNKHKSSFLRC